MDDYPNLKEVMELAKLRIKSREEYENMMANLFGVYTDFVVFEKEFEKVVRNIEKNQAKKVERKD